MVAGTESVFVGGLQEGAAARVPGPEVTDVVVPPNAVPLPDLSSAEKKVINYATTIVMGVI